ncbi:hypothetical protein J6TS7_53930 [Paenibacillus dendritiformis]|nr:hypothetical protein J6TS7_53930 [Paenibacillus dendritiformis]
MMCNLKNARVQEHEAKAKRLEPPDGNKNAATGVNLEIESAYTHRRD